MCVRSPGIGRETVVGRPALPKSALQLCTKLRPGKRLERFGESATLPLLGTRQMEEGGFRVANEQFEQIPFT